MDIEYSLPRFLLISIMLHE